MHLCVKKKERIIDDQDCAVCAKQPLWLGLTNTLCMSFAVAFLLEYVFLLNKKVICDLKYPDLIL